MAALSRMDAPTREDETALSDEKSRSAADLGALARGGALNLVGVVANGVLAFVLVVIVTRGLGGTATGLFFESVALFTIVGSVAQWGADVGVVRMIPRYAVLERTHDVRTVLWSAALPAAAVGTAFGLGLFVFAEPLARLLTHGRHGTDLARMIRVLAPFVPVYAVYTMVLGATRGFATMVPTTLIDKIARASAQPAFVLLAVAAGWSMTAMALGWVMPFSAGLLLGGWWLVRLLRRAERRATPRPAAPAFAVFREFWRFTGPRGLANTFSIAVLWLDTLLIGSLRSTTEAGVYAAATRYLTLGQFVGLAIGQVAAPRLSRLLTAREHARARTVYATSTSWLVIVAWPLYLTMIVLGPALVSIFGTGYGRADAVLAILGGSMLVATIVGPVDVVLLMAGKSSWNLVNTLVAVVVNVVLNLLLIPPLGITGAAIAWGASILVNNLLPLAQVWRGVGLHPFGRGTIVAAGTALLVFAGLSGVVRLALGPGFAAVLVTAIVGGPLYLVLLWRFRDPLELTSMREIVRRPRRSVAPSERAN